GKIVYIENELKVEDAKSTVWVIKALFMSVFCLLLFGIGIEAWRTMRIPVQVVFHDLVEWILQTIGI
ncbi:MAG: hypothetical protein ABL958_19200, partial [Bdellovibrionia bacterium]